MELTALPSVIHEITVDATPTQAFEIFAEHLGDWWPIAYTFNGPRFDTAVIEARVGGRWFERSLDGEDVSWGSVREYRAGERLVLEFGIGPDRRPAPPGQSSEVEIRFVRDRSGARVVVEHRDFARHGSAGQKVRDGMDSDQGWRLILAELRRGIRHLVARPSRSSGCA